MNTPLLERITVPLAGGLHANHMSCLGLRKTMELAHAYNRLKHGQQDEWRRSLYRDQWPVFLDFATSSDILWPVSEYLQCIPVPSTTLPAGIRLMESNARFDDQPDRPHDSQLYHIDYYSLPNVNVWVRLRDTAIEQGPWTFLPRSSSQKAAAALGNWERGRGCRFSDEAVHSVADRNEVIQFAHPRGTVLFIQSSGCFHYGSCNAVQSRFQLMLGYSGVCRRDFSELIMTPKEYPIQTADSRLRRMVLDRNSIA